MIGNEENQRLTDVSPGTPAGDLLRQYWHPVVPSEALGPGEVLGETLLDEELVLYRDAEGTVRAAAQSCPHRGASLVYGHVVTGGIRCAYHGWRFDAAGRCVERPFEQAQPTTDCHLTAFHAREIAGLVFVCLSRESTPPPFPLWDILARADVRHRVDVQEDLMCNWLQIQENAADVTHTWFLHSDQLRRSGREDVSGFSKPMVRFGFQPFPWGLVKSWTHRDGDGRELSGWGNMLVFPTMLRIETEMHWRVPLTRSRTRVVILAMEVGVDGPPYVRRLPPRTDATGRYTMADFYSQDAMAWETQGAVYDRTAEHLGASDVGIVMFRDMLRSAIADHAAGRRPMAQTPDACEDVIDLRQWMDGYLPMSAPADPTPVERHPAATVFDGRHRSYDVPS